MASICVGSELEQTFCIFHPNFSLRLKVFSGDGEIWNELPTLCTSWDLWITTWHVMFVTSHIFRTISYWLNIETCSLEMCQIWRFGDTRLSWHVTRGWRDHWPLINNLNTPDMIMKSSTLFLIVYEFESQNVMTAFSLFIITKSPNV